MKLERWARWAEIGASAAVVASLHLLVQQVRQNTVMLERQIALDRATAFKPPSWTTLPWRRSWAGSRPSTARSRWRRR